MIPIFVILSLCTIPITAITANYFYKVKKLKLGQNLSLAEQQKIEQLLQENEELRERLVNVEMIVANADIDLLLSSASTEDLKELKDTVGKMKAQNRFKIN